jgi:hypothetical protein
MDFSNGSIQVLCNSRKTGKYISIENGPSAVREPKIRIN